MSIQAMLMPVFAQVALTFVLLFWMQLLRSARSGAARSIRHQVRCASPTGRRA